MSDSNDDKAAVYCPTCNVKVEANVVAGHTQYVARDPPALGGIEDTPHDVTVYSLAECNRCKQIFLTKMEYYVIPGEVEAPQTDLITLYPAVSRFDDSELPDSAARAYRDASRSYQTGLYEPCVIMCRKCLEAICHQHGCEVGNLKSRLETLRKKGIVDDKLLSWANGLRLVGNDAAHQMDILVGKDDARDSLEFIEAVFLYVFSLDKRFQAFERRRQAAKDESRKPSSS